MMLSKSSLEQSNFTEVLLLAQRIQLVDTIRIAPQRISELQKDETLTVGMKLFIPSVLPSFFSITAPFLQL